MKAIYRLKRRKGIYYSFHCASGKRQSLATRNKAEAVALLAAKNQATQQPILNLKMAKVYLSGSDPEATTRTWRDVLQFMIASKSGENKQRWARMDRHRPLTSLWNKIVIETTAGDLLTILNRGTVTTNKFLRVIHNFVLDLDWIGQRIIPKKLWPKVVHAEKRGITAEEHALITGREPNPERKAFYELAWHTGAAQSDLAHLNG